VSRFTEVLGVAQENTQSSGYPDNQPDSSAEDNQTTQPDTQPSTQPDTTSTLENPESSSAASTFDNFSGDANTQPSTQPTTTSAKKSASSSDGKSRHGRKRPSANKAQQEAILSGNKQQSTQLDTQPSTQIHTQITANGNEYPDTQSSSQLQTETNSATQTALQDDVTESVNTTATHLDTQQPEHLPNKPLVDQSVNLPSTHLDTQQPMQATKEISNSDNQLGSQVAGYPAIQQPTQPSEKLAKRENPDYTQTTFRIPKKLSRDINRVLMNLEDEGVYMDRSDLLEEIAGAFIKLAKEEGEKAALLKIKNLGIQVSE
jgi:hypothetical protein